MSSVEKYQSLKLDGSWIDRVKHVLSLSNKSEIENYLKQSLTKSYDDLQMFIFLSTSTKNTENLLTVFQNAGLPAKQRGQAIKSWLQLQTNSDSVETFVVETINDQNVPRYLKHQILRALHRVDVSKKAPSFFYNLAKRLTEQNNPREYNLDAYLLPFTTLEQIQNLLSQWSIERFEQLNPSSALYSKLLVYQPSIIIKLIQADLNKIKSNSDKFLNYFSTKQSVLDTIVKKQPKQLISLFIEYMKQLEKQHQFMPNVVESNVKYLFEKAPNEMIELFLTIASNQAGTIKRQHRYNNRYYAFNFSLPHSFTIENYVRLFMGLYETCRWSTNYLPHILDCMLIEKNEDTSLSSWKKERQWFYDTVVCQRIGKDIFIQKLIEQANQSTLEQLSGYTDLTTPLAAHLLSVAERQGVVAVPSRLSYLEYQTMTNEFFEQLLSLFKQVSSDAEKRADNYPLLFKCALRTNEEFVQKALQWVEKRLTNEQLFVIERFIRELRESSTKFNLKILPKNSDSVKNIINLALNHLQRTTSTINIIVNYAVDLLKQSERHRNENEKKLIQQFATQLLTQCYETDIKTSVQAGAINKSCPEATRILNNFLLNNVFPKLISKSNIDPIESYLSGYESCSRTPSEIDSFLDTFFRQTLPSSTKLLALFHVETHNSLIKLYLKNHSTRVERVNYLLTKLDRVFLFNQTVQRTAVRSQQFRKLIDQLVEEEKTVTPENFVDEDTKFTANQSIQSYSNYLPGLRFEILNVYSQYLTSKQQDHIRNTILSDFFQNGEVPNLDKVHSFRVLRRFARSYDEIVQTIKEKSPDETEERTRSSGRGLNSDSLKDILICLPATFDLNPEKLLEYFQYLKTKLNAANAKYISDAFLSLLQRMPDQMFLQAYSEFISNERFSTFGITANKEILRLLIQYSNQTKFIESIIEPWWEKKPHQDIRACLVVIVLHFLVNAKSTENIDAIWNILNEAAEDEYSPVVEALFQSGEHNSSWPLLSLKKTSSPLYEKFVNEIQLKVLDHSASLEIRSIAWARIDCEFVDVNKLIKKTQDLSCLFDKNGNTLWTSALNSLIQLFKLNRITSVNTFVDILKNMMSHEKDIDEKQNGIDSLHDLPVFHRIRQTLDILKNSIESFDSQKKRQLSSLVSIVLQFNKTLAPIIGEILIKIAQDREELEQALKSLEDNLPSYYFQRVLTGLAQLIANEKSSPFITQLNIEEKLDLAEWFIREKKRPSFIFDLIKENVFDQSSVDKQRCRNLIQQIRQVDDLYLKQQAMEYVVPWD